MVLPRAEKSIDMVKEQRVLTLTQYKIHFQGTYRKHYAAHESKFLRSIQLPVLCIDEQT